MELVIITSSFPILYVITLCYVRRLFFSHDER